MIFLDTSVIVAASTASDVRHDSCLAVLELADKLGGACSSHTLAEVFSTLTARPGSIRMSPRDAAKIVSHIRHRFTLITLTPTEYVNSIEGLARLGHSGGMVYDALLLACARKSKAKEIYTLNVRHFRSVAPDLAAKIVEP